MLGRCIVGRRLIEGPGEAAIALENRQLIIAVNMSLQDSASCVGFLPTPASTMPSIYNTYLCKEPVGDVPLLIRNGPDEYTGLLRTLQRSTEHFSHKDSGRAIERIQLEVARLHMQNQSWDRAMRVLFPLWQTLSWRRCGWWNLLEEVTWALRECAGAVKDLETLIAVEWELLHSCTLYVPARSKSL